LLVALDEKVDVALLGSLASGLASEHDVLAGRRL
jgi:hypothetical protein